MLADIEALIKTRQPQIDAAHSEKPSEIAALTS